MDLLTLPTTLIDVSGFTLPPAMENPQTADDSGQEEFTHLLLGMLSRPSQTQNLPQPDISAEAVSLYEKSDDVRDEPLQQLVPTDARQQLLDTLLMANQMPVQASEPLLVAITESEDPSLVLKTAQALPLRAREETLSLPKQDTARMLLSQLTMTDSETWISAIKVPQGQERSAAAIPVPAQVAPSQAITTAIPSMTESVHSMLPLSAFSSVPQAAAASPDMPVTLQPTAQLARPIVLDPEDNRWANQLQSALGERLQIQVKNQIQHATIRLDPPDMGKIDIAVKLDNGRVQVHISASHAEVYRALQQTSSDLRQSLTEHNFVQVNVQVSSQSSQHHQGRGHAFNEQQHAAIAAGAEMHGDEHEAFRRDDDSVLLTV